MQKSSTLRTERTEAAQAPRARGRPRAFDRAAALTQAMRLFWAKGFSATSISDLTEAMGIGSPSLYAAFGSKEALYAEALEHYVAQTDRRIWAGFDASPSAREAIGALLLSTATALASAEDRADPAGCMVLLSAVGGEGQSALGDLVRARRAGVLERIRARLDRAMTEGELPRGTDTAAVARFYHAVQGGLSLQARDGARSAELEAAARAAMAGWEAFSAR